MGRSMGESTKSVCVLLMIVGAVLAAFAWTADHPDAMTWALRIGTLAAILLPLGLLLKLHYRHDLEPDYLRAVTGNYFNRDGFCFAFAVTAIERTAFMEAYFQTQRDVPCVGRIAMRPNRDFWMSRAKIDAILFEIDCQPGAFGVARMAIPIPVDRQGKQQSFEVGAAVDYPAGKGRRIRYHDGVFLRANTKFADSFRTALMIGSAVTGQIHLFEPETVTVTLPIGVADEISDPIDAQIETIWKSGDPPL